MVFDSFEKMSSNPYPPQKNLSIFKYISNLTMQVNCRKILFYVAVIQLASFSGIPHYALLWNVMNLRDSSFLIFSETKLIAEFAVLPTNFYNVHLVALLTSGMR